METFFDQRGVTRDLHGQWRAERLLAQGKEYGLPRDHQAERAMVAERAYHARPLVERIRELAQSLEQDAPQAGSAMRIRLHEREREEERDRGMGWGF